MLEPPADLDGLVDAWSTSIKDIQQVASDLQAQQWQLPTGCPGWSVADVVAHVVDAESMIAGEPRTDHEPNWPALPHVTSDFARLTEIGVDARRGSSPQELLSELERVIARREHQLASGPLDLTAEVPAFTAATLPLGRLLTMRTFDTWVHSQDIRDAIGQQGGLGSPGAQVTASLMLAAMPRVWAKVVGAPSGSVLRLDILGPGVTASALVEVMPDGRAKMTEPQPGTQAAADAWLRGSWPAVMHRMAGRPLPSGMLGLELGGDPDLVTRLSPALNIAP